ncbi:unnamed protein product [Thelazia callipaeda]|uniref:Ion_trans_2 domain-containing protein n=1 Tax=Thelazia callipaeda TaxID=103827 RepID=A0A0N5D6I5_THECL|nr:unnamed protein product [Thelazia callipaeda]
MQKGYKIVLNERKVLTKCLKAPWYLTKCGYRRLFCYYTRKTSEIQKLDVEEFTAFKNDILDLENFDLPIPVAISVVIAWIFICSATFCIWEKDWDYFVAFYFFFISLSTIGLGDITPTQPKYLLMLFIYIIIGLALVSMCINLIQAQMAKTYEVGQLDNLSLASANVDHSFANINKKISRLSSDSSRRASLGIFKSSKNIACGSSSKRSISRETVRNALFDKKNLNKCTQTMLSFPSPSRSSTIYRHAHNSKIKFLPRNLSLDDVMKLVDTEEGDIIVLTDLIRDESNTSDLSDVSDISNQSDLTIKPYSRSSLLPNSPSTYHIKNTFCNHFCPTGSYFTPSMHDIEAFEEIEDQILLEKINTVSNLSGVHFRSRLSLIPEIHNAKDEDYANEENTNDTQLLGSKLSVERQTSMKLPLPLHKY